MFPFSISLILFIAVFQALPPQVQAKLKLIGMIVSFPILFFMFIIMGAGAGEIIFEVLWGVIKLIFMIPKTVIYLIGLSVGMPNGWL